MAAEGLLASLGVAGMAGNPLFGAGAGLLVLGFGLTTLGRASRVGVQLAKRRFFVSLEVTRKDPAYPWVLKWMAKNNTHSRHLSLTTTVKTLNNGTQLAKYDFFPNVGRHFFQFNNTWLQVERLRESGSVDREGHAWETVKITTFASQKDTIFELLDLSRKAAVRELQGKMIVYQARGPEWFEFGNPRNKRPFKSVLLKDDDANELKEDVEAFLQKSEKYHARGTPYRRGYLLYGPPGCGKTSFIQALAGELNHNICIMNLADRTLSDETLCLLLSTAPERSIILLEDIDAAFASRDVARKIDDGPHARFLNFVTLSGLLNALDGVPATEGRIVFMTTNYPERLDPALVRPGRVDKKKKLGLAMNSQISNLTRRFYPDATDDQVQAFVDKVPEDTMSLAHLQGYFLTHEDDLKKATDAFDDYFKSEFKNDQKVAQDQQESVQNNIYK